VLGTRIKDEQLEQRLLRWSGMCLGKKSTSVGARANETGKGGKSEVKSSQRGY